MKLYFSRNLMVSSKWYILPILFLLTCFLIFKSNAQNPINYVEYYMDQDPGIGKANAVSITSGVNVTNASFNIDVANIKTGIHIVGSRARTSAGVWGMTHHWFVFKPFPAITPSNIDNIVKVEYYVDNDPGFGKGTAATITAGTNLQNIVFNIDPSAYSKGTHMIGVRALTTANIWSHTNYWLFYNSFDVTPPPSALSNINYVEYYVNTDPGFGKGIPVTITSSTDISNTAFNAAIDTVKPGTSMIGVRARSTNGAWSYTNYLLFVKPFGLTPAPAAPGNITSVEYFLDYDPGIGNATPISITAGTNLANLSFNVNLSNIVPGNHFVSVRARDANGKWSLVNSWPFSIPGTIPSFTTTFNSTNVCVGDSIQVGYSAKGIIFNANNKFIVQLSNPNTNNFNNPIQIGEVVSNKDTGLIKVLIPANLTGTYRVRVVSTSQSILGTDNGNYFNINALPSAPVISPSKDTAICTGKAINLFSNIGGTLEWFLNKNIIANATSTSYTANAAGRYNVRFISTFGCKSDTSKGISVSLTALPPIPTISSNKNTSFCVGDSVVLTSSAITGNQWYLNGAAIAASVQNSITVKTSGVYTVSVVNGSGCISSSINTTVTANAFPSTPVISNSRPLSFLAGDSTILTSSSPTGNQWLLNGVNIAGATGTSITVKAAGNYTVIVSNATGCSTTSAATVVTINAAAIIPVISNNRPLSFCVGDSTVLTSSIATGNQWYLNGTAISGFTGATYTAKASGSYTVINNSQTSVAVVVTANSLPATPVISNSRPLTFSNGDSTILTSSSGTGNQWLLNGSNITGATASSIIVKAAGVYSVKVTNGSGCTATSTTVTITVNAATATPVISNSRPLSFCVGDSTVLTSSIATGNQWYLNGTVITGSTGASYTAKTSGSYTVSNNAQISAAVVVNANSLPATPVISNSRPLTFNSGDSTILTSSSGTGNQWLLNGSNIAGATATSIVIKTTGTYSVRVTNGSGCTTTSTSVTVTVNGAVATPVISNSRPLSFCVGDSTVLTSSIATGNQWYLNGAVITGSTGANYIATTSGSYTVSNNAQISVAVVVTANSLPATPVISNSRPLTFNSGDSTILTSSSGTGNQWLLNGSNITGSNGISIVVKTAGTYSVKVTNGSGCTATSTSVTVTVNAASATPIISYNRPLSFCTGDSTVLTSSIATGNQWYLNGTVISGSTGATYTAKTSGTYTVMNNAKLSAGVIVTANTVPAKPTISRDVNNNLVSSSSTGNQWYTDTNTVVSGGTQQLFKPLSAGYYSVKVTQNGCSSIFSDKYYYLVTAVPILATSSEIKLYPNPVNNYLILSHKLPGVTNLNIDIVDINGKKLIMKKGLRSGDQIDISNLQSGVYYLKCNNGSVKQEYVLKFVKL